MTRFDLVTIGELLYVLRAPYPGRLEQTPTLSCHVGGAEANVAIGVTRLGWSAALITRSPTTSSAASPSTRSAAPELMCLASSGRTRAAWVCCSRSLASRRGRPRASTTGCTAPSRSWRRRSWIGPTCARPSAYSSAGSRPRWAIGLAAGTTRRAGGQERRNTGRLRLQSPRAAVVDRRGPRLCRAAARRRGRVVLKADEARSILGLAGEPAEIVERLRGDHGIEIVVLSLGGDGAIASDGTIAQAPAIPVQIVNRFGMGDAFIAGFLYGHASGGLRQGLNYGRALAALKATYANENFALVSRADVERLLGTMNGGGDTAVQGEIAR